MTLALYLRRANWRRRAYNLSDQTVSSKIRMSNYSLIPGHREYMAVQTVDAHNGGMVNLQTSVTKTYFYNIFRDTTLEALPRFTDRLR